MHKKIVSKRRPEYLITLFCQECKLDFAVADTESDPQCFYCESFEEFEGVKRAKNYVELKREKITPEVMAARLAYVTDRMNSFLKKAYDFRPDDVDEGVLLETMDKGQSLSRGIARLFEKKKGKGKGKAELKRDELKKGEAKAKAKAKGKRK